ncbi:MAG: thiamine kinase [Candidatus Azotimanducaceae bacterium]
MNLEHILKDWSKWSSAPAKVIRPLGGLSNASYLIQTGTDHLVIRINQIDEGFGISRTRENNVLSAIAHCAFAPKIRFEHPCYLVSEYAVAVDENLLEPEEMGALFRQIHEIPFADDHIFDLKFQINLYYQQIPNPESALKRCLEKVSDIALAEGPPQLCHNDLLPANIIRSVKGTTVIDWEYAQLGDPLFDLAVYAESLSLTQTKTMELISTYGKKIDELSLMKNRLCYALIETLWWKLKKPQIDITLRLKKLEKRLAYLN